MKFNFDKRLGMMVPEKPQRTMLNSIMMRPNRSCYIELYMNDNPNSVGNIRYKSVAWYDHRDNTLSTSEEKDDAVNFRMFKLKNGGGFPKYWKYCDGNGIPRNWR